MIVSEEEAFARLNSPNNLVNQLKVLHSEIEYEELEVEETKVEIIPPKSSNVQIEDLHWGRTGPKNIPPMIQTLAVELAAVGTQKDAAEFAGVSQQTVSSYASGKAGNPDLTKARSRINDLHTTALDAMIDSIELLKPKLKDVKKATDLSVIASNLGKVVSKTTPKESATTNVRVVVFAPAQKDEDYYEEMVVS